MLKPNFGSDLHHHPSLLTHLARRDLQPPQYSSTFAFLQPGFVCQLDARSVRANYPSREVVSGLTRFVQTEEWTSLLCAVILSSSHADIYRRSLMMWGAPP
jgi:hypothetical protein